MFFRKRRNELKKEIKEMEAKLIRLRVEESKIKETIANMLLQIKVKSFHEAILQAASEVKFFGEDGFPDMAGAYSIYETRAEFEEVKQIEKVFQKLWILQRPELKIRKIFHGGCHGCVTPYRKRYRNLFKVSVF